jgi:quercetin dioxygenase-like cupin family protein
MRSSNAIALGLLLLCSTSYAQQPAPKITTVMEEVPVAGQPDKVFDLYSLEWGANATMPLHSHPGDEYGMVIKGAYGLRQMDGQWKTYAAGEGFNVPAGVVHEGKNMTVSTTTVHAFVVDKNKRVIQPYTKP